MELKQLEVFYKVVELGGFSRAAKALYLTQPTISEHIKALEDSVGTKLLDRLGREVIPTKAGRLLYEYVEKIIKLKGEAEQALNQFLGKIKGNLFVGGSTIPGSYVLPPILGNFKQCYHDVSITLTIGNSAEIIEGVLSGRIELGIVGAKTDEWRAEYIDFIKDELILLVPSDHPWAEKCHISFKELMEEPFIIREKGSGSRLVLERKLRDLGVNMDDLKIVAELGSTEAVIQGIKARVGVSFVSRRAVEEELNYGILKEIKLNSFSLERKFYIVSDRSRAKSPLCKIFMDFLLYTGL